MSEENQVQETTQPENLTINDLVVFKDIITLSTQRGAFKPEELEVVGKTYTKLVTFLDAVTKAEENKEESQPEAVAQEVDNG
jgi:hypothetical protein